MRIERDNTKERQRLRESKRQRQAERRDDGEEQLQRDRKKDQDRDSQRRETHRKMESLAAASWAQVVLLRLGQRVVGGGPGPGARTGWAKVTVSASLCCTKEVCW